jgi:hypothetical protein
MTKDITFKHCVHVRYLEIGGPSAGPHGRKDRYAHHAHDPFNLRCNIMIC